MSASTKKRLDATPHGFLTPQAVYISRALTAAALCAAAVLFLRYLARLRPMVERGIFAARRIIEALQPVSANVRQIDIDVDHDTAHGKQENTACPKKRRLGKVAVKGR